MMTRSTKLISALLVTAILAGLFGINLIIPQIAEAQNPVTVTSVTDPSTLAFYVHEGVQLTALNTSGGATAGSTGGSLSKTIADYALKIAGQILKKVILDRLVDSLIDWINSGGRGAVVSDWKQFLNDAGQQAVGELAQEVGAGFLCSPFNLQVQLTLAPVQRFSQQVTCTLDSITGNIQAFFDDFRNGNWIAYQQLWAPQNNFYGATLLATDEAQQRDFEARQAAQNEAIAGQGFLSFQKCDTDANGKTVCHTTTPGGLVGEAAKQALVTSPINSIIGADDIASYITAIADAAINRLIKSGVEGLQNLGHTNTFTPPNPAQDLGGAVYTASQQFQTVQNASVSLDQQYYLNQINTTLNPRQQADQLFGQAITAETNVVTALETLASCHPTDQSVQSQLVVEQGALNLLQNEQDDNLSFVAPLVQAQQDIANAQDETSLSTAFAPVQSLLDPTAAQQTLDQATQEKNTATAKTVPDTAGCPALNATNTPPTP